MNKKVTLAVLGILAAGLLIFGIVSVALTISLGDNTQTTGESSTESSAEESSTESSAEESSTEASTEESKPGFFETLFNKEEEETTEVVTTKPPYVGEKIDDYEYAYAGFEPVYANVEIDDWKMLLVNRDYILPEDYEVELAPCITDNPDSLSLDYRVAPHYNEMYLAALEDGIELTPVSGYRSVERQQRNFENKIQKYIDEGYSKTEATQMAATIILPPGTSEHNAGLAMDICSLYQNFDESDEFEWLCENAADYGFILRYPEDKQDITNIIYEPWHWRYVGVEAAKEMKASGECLEEYLGVAD